MPSILALFVSVTIHPWWTGLLILPVMGTLCLGYFPLGNFGRALWLFLQYVVVGAGLLLTGHIHWYFYLAYCVLGGVLGGTLVNLWQPLGDFIEGFCLGAIVFLIH